MKKSKLKEKRVAENYRDREYGDFTITCFLIVVHENELCYSVRAGWETLGKLRFETSKIIIFFPSYFKSLNFKYKYKSFFQT